MLHRHLRPDTLYGARALQPTRPRSLASSLPQVYLAAPDLTPDDGDDVIEVVLVDMSQVCGWRSDQSHASRDESGATTVLPIPPVGIP